jgi:hypothetical protein
LCLLAVLFWFIAGCTSVCLKERYVKTK